MHRLFFNFIFLWVGNISMWLYYGGEQKMEEVAKEDNETVGVIISIIFGFILFFSFQ